MGCIGEGPGRSGRAHERAPAPACSAPSIATPERVISDGRFPALTPALLSKPTAAAAIIRACAVPGGKGWQCPGALRPPTVAPHAGALHPGAAGQARRLSTISPQSSARQRGRDMTATQATRHRPHLRARPPRPRGLRAELGRTAVVTRASTSQCSSAAVLCRLAVRVASAYSQRHIWIYRVSVGG